MRTAGVCRGLGAARLAIAAAISAILFIFIHTTPARAQSPPSTAAPAQAPVLLKVFLDCDMCD
jgi:hypothetical protein